MAQTATTLANVLKEAWSDDVIQKQYFIDDGPLTRIEAATDAVQMGRQVQVPIQSDLNSGGYTSTSSAGGVLNAATNQPTNQALFTLSQHFFPIGLEFSALNQSGNNIQSVVSGKNLEVESGIDTLRNQATRQLVTNGDSIVAACGSATSATVPLVASPSGTAYGYDAIVRNWLRPGAVVDIGTTADTDALVTATTVTGVTESASAPTITIGTSITTVAGTHFVYIANPNSATAANPELNGLRNIINTTGALGGLNPTTAGQEFWQAAARDTSTTVLSLDLMLNLSRAVQQKTGKSETEVWFGLKQRQNYYSLLQNQVRFAGDSVGAGNTEARWGGMVPRAYNAVLDSDVFFLNPSDLFRVTGSIKSPTWMSSLQGANQGMLWTSGTTAFGDAVGWALQLGCRRRNGMAAATSLTA